MTTLLWNHVTPPPPEVFFRRGDPNDPRLGEVVLTTPSAYERSDLVLLGLPQDEGVQRNQGRVGARKAPDAIRTYLYRMVALHHARINLFDLGNTRLESTLEATHERHMEVVRQVLRDGKRLIVLGGGNDTSFPDCAALAKESRRVLAFNIDAHFDVRVDTPCNSGTPYRQLLEGQYIRPDDFYEVGSVPFANSATYRDYLLQRGVTIYSLNHLLETGIPVLFKPILADSVADAIFWGIDLDVVNVSEAPGVSAPNPLGITGHHLCQITALAATDRRTRILEFTEVNPEHDSDGRTCRLTAAAIYHALMSFNIHLHQEG